MGEGGHGATVQQCMLWVRVGVYVGMEQQLSSAVGEGGRVCGDGATAQQCCG